MLHDLRLALRSLLRSPGFTVVSVLMLAVGIGLSIYMFGAINAFALKPLPFPEAGRLVHFKYTERANPERSLDLPQADWLALRERQQSLESLAAYTVGTANLGGFDGPPERLSGAWVSPDAFGVLGFKPLLGRDFTCADARPGAPPVALVAHRTWELLLDADPQVVGRRVRVNGNPVEIIGVMPEGFAFPLTEALWQPLKMDSSIAPDADLPAVDTFGRLRDGVTREQAQAEFAGLMQRLGGERTAPLAGDAPKMQAFSDAFILPQIRQATYAMSLAVLLVLLIACTNVAALMTARFSARTREMGIRTALGASRRRLIGQVLAESLLIAAAAAALGWLGTELWMHYGSGTGTEQYGNLPWWVDFHSNATDVLVCGLIAFLAALAAGLAPALGSSRLDVQASLRAGGGHGASSRRRGPGRFLVSAEVALGVVLLIGAGVAIKSALDSQASELGIRVDGVLTGRIGLFEADYPDAAARARFAETLEARLRELPGARAATVASTLPLMGFEREHYARAGDAVDETGTLPRAWLSRVSDGFFRTFDVALREGRLFDRRDSADAPTVAIVSAALAAHAWPGESALGQRLRLDPADPASPSLEVVGVVADSMQADYLQTGATLSAHRTDGNIYRPLAQDPPAFLSFAVHAGGNPGALGEAVRQAVRGIDANLPVYWLRPMQEWRGKIFWGQEILASMFSVFAVFAVLLAAAGIYAVLAFDVTARTREIGVRRALGAPAASVLAMVLRRGARQVAIGLAVGLPLAWAFTLLLGRMLMPGSRSAPGVYAAVVAVLALAVTLAAWLPARRALKVDPMVALRSE
ncbi:MAG: ABC transporter permease [Xanthomonadales bacterium]|nr:ABC transporter permease [Xanthomonadales bacterium]